MKRLLLFMLVMMMCFSMCACGSEESSSYDYFDAESAALDAARQHIKKSYVSYEIARELGLSDYNPPSFLEGDAFCDIEISEGDWHIYWIGEMFGYSSSLPAEERYFSCDMTVTDSGVVTINEMKEVDSFTVMMLEAMYDKKQSEAAG